MRMRAPMMLIHTVAAGGGSILHFDGAALPRRPGLAGANPGPKCLPQRGGPLAVTDANVMVGKLQPDLFPPIFGPRPQRPAARCRCREAGLRRDGGRGRRRPFSPEEVADGFIRSRSPTWPNAIKKISVQRGYDVTRYALNCFGGAGGQHACLVADALGMTDGADPSVLGPALGLWHGPRRHPRDPPAGGRGAFRRKPAGARPELGAEASADGKA